MGKITVAVKMVGEELKLMDIEDSMESYQEIVGGHFECVFLEYKYVMICNEDGRRLGLPVNFRTKYDAVVGNVFFAKLNGEYLESLTKFDFGYLKQLLEDITV